MSFQFASVTKWFSFPAKIPTYSVSFFKGTKSVFTSNTYYSIIVSSVLTSLRNQESTNKNPGLTYSHYHIVIFVGFSNPYSFLWILNFHTSNRSFVRFFILILWSSYRLLGFRLLRYISRKFFNTDVISYTCNHDQLICNYLYNISYVCVMRKLLINIKYRHHRMGNMW